MGIPSDSWVSAVTREWYGSSLTPDQFQQMWQDFLSSPDVKYLPANATPEEYHALYLQYISGQISSADPWFSQITEAVYGNTLTDAEVQQMIQSFLALPEVVSMPQPSSRAAYQNLYLEYLTENVLSQDPWYQNATQAFYGPVTSDQLEILLLNFLGSPAVQALPSTATATDYQQLYMQFLSFQLQQAHQIEQATAVSPEAAAQSEIMMSIFELLAKMTEQTAIAQITDSKVITFLTEKQEQYAKMLASVPLYVGGGIADLNLNAALKSVGLNILASTTNPNVPSSNFGNEPSPANAMADWWNDLFMGSPPEAIGTLTPAAGTNVPVQQLVEQMLAQDETSVDCGSVSGGFANGQHLIFVITPPPSGSKQYTFTAEFTGGTGGTWKLHKENFTLTSSTTVQQRNVLVSNADSVFTPISPSSDPSKFYLGYGDITLQQISQEVAAQYAASTLPTSATTPGATYNLYSGTWAQGPDYWVNDIQITVAPESGVTGNPTVTVKFLRSNVPSGDEARNSDNSINWATSTNVITNQLFSSTVNLTDSSDQETMTNAINSAFQSVWSQASAANDIMVTNSANLPSNLPSLAGQGPQYINYVMNAMNPKIPYPPGSLTAWVEPGQTMSTFQAATLTQFQQPSTAQLNQLENAYIGGIHSREDVIGNFISQQQQVINASSQGLTSISNIINSTLQELVQILNTVFR